MLRRIIRKGVRETSKTLDAARCARRLRDAGQEGEELYDSRTSPASVWTIRDERWSRVVNRFNDRKRLQEGRSLTLPDRAPAADLRGVEVEQDIRVDVPAEDRERWVYLHMDPARYLWHNYRWRMNVRRESEFRELQFGFRYVNFYNRYRFRHERDAVRFDIVANGRFYNDRVVEPMRMDPGRDYLYEITVLDNCFELRVDDVVMIRTRDSRRRFDRGPLAIILWQDDRVTPIRARIGEITCTELLLPSEQSGR